MHEANAVTQLGLVAKQWQSPISQPANYYIFIFVSYFVSYSTNCLINTVLSQATAHPPIFRQFCAFSEVLRVTAHPAPEVHQNDHNWRE